MPARTLTGSRIRERRALAGLKQAELARRVGVSPAYLNLIEHNRRRIGGKLLVDLARELGVEPASLAEGAEAALVAGLRDAAAAAPEVATEAGREEEFAQRFPGWAALVVEQARRIAGLERTVEALTDRLTHDPHLAASLHEVLSTVTAIHSTASILEETRDIDPEWRARFHRNINEDSERLADSAQALVSYLDAAGQDAIGFTAPQEELEAWLEAMGHHVAALEGEAPADPDALIDGAGQLVTASARALARAYLDRYRTDAVAMPLAPFLAAVGETGRDPARLARRFGTDLAAALRRLATLPDDGGPRAGLVICDGSGTLTFRKPVDGFSVPRFGAACPLWPLYQALARPMQPIRATVEQAGRDPVRYRAYAVSQPAGRADFDAPAVFEATMLLLPDEPAAAAARAPLQLGASCRICARADCAARREPSILAEGI